MISASSGSWITDSAFFQVIKRVSQTKSHEWLGVPIEIPISVLLSVIGFFLSGYFQRRLKNRKEIRDLVESESYYYRRLGALLELSREQAKNFDEYVKSLKTLKLKTTDLVGVDVVPIEVFLGQSHDRIFRAFVLNKSGKLTDKDDAVSTIYEAVGVMAGIIRGVKDHQSRFLQADGYQQVQMNAYLGQFQDFSNNYISEKKSLVLMAQRGDIRALFYFEVDAINSQLAIAIKESPNEPTVPIPFFAQLEKLVIDEKWFEVEDARSLLKIVQGFELEYRNFVNLRKRYEELYAGYAVALRKRADELEKAIQSLKDIPAKLPSYIPGYYSDLRAD
ncbi:MAG TPA: hypothetical protein VG537_00470 [Candidatus Kapabacteria bacterium]|jgi:hypothetical protein|nr:hypothetical protein [Candidatus Kapabacteria bacterium]